MFLAALVTVAALACQPEPTATPSVTIFPPPTATPVPPPTGAATPMPQETAPAPTETPGFPFPPTPLNADDLDFLPDAALGRVVGRNPGSGYPRENH